jgi:uncharacterized membrane protein
MDALIELLNVDIAALVPDLSSLLGRVQLFSALSVLLGPVLLLLFGGWYLLAPPKEANHKIGFRTYFGMGSVAAWQYTQRLAGIIWAGLGAALLLIMAIVCLTFIGKDAGRIAGTAFTCLVWQAILTLLSRLVIAILAAKHFDKDGNRR